MAETLNPQTALRRFEAAAVIKSNPVREVRSDGEFFYKLDRRGGGALRSEFAAARLLEKAHVPVVKHLWCDRTAAGTMLVTRALAAAPTVSEYAHARKPDARFRADFADFIRDFLETGLDHRDMHVGNILYHVPEARFVLVDVCAVRRFRLRRFPYDICRAPLELRRHLTRREVCDMLARIGLADPGAFFDRALCIEAQALRSAWPKRRSQILAGYPKFTRREGDLLIAAWASPEALADVGFRSGGAEEFSDSFYWDLAEIPHRRALVWDRAAGRIGYERTPEFSPLPENELEERARIFGSGKDRCLSR